MMTSMKIPAIVFGLNWRTQFVGLDWAVKWTKIQ